MTKIRKNVIGAILCLVMLLVGVCAFTACGSKDLSVTFTVEGKTQTLDVVNGKVTMPADPEKEFYEFRGWYTTSTFDEGTEFTKDTEVKRKSYGIRVFCACSRRHFRERRSRLPI